MALTPVFPTTLHRDVAEIIREYFLSIPGVDTILVVNSCARGQATSESDLDMAVLVNPETSNREITEMDAAWQTYSDSQSTIIKFKQSTPFAHLHLDIIEAKYIPQTIEVGEPIDTFEIEIGNQICHSAPFSDEGIYFGQLKNKWLPYYPNELRIERFQRLQTACNYDLNQIPFLVKRGLHYHAFYILYKAFREFLQLLFIAEQTYPIAYNKWIKYQITNWLKMPELYPLLSPILSVSNIDSGEVNQKAILLKNLLDILDPG